MAAPQLEKVTAFVTRGVGDAAELLVFRHGRGGVQVPAGTVEEGEAPDPAVLRELEEETGLAAVRLVQMLGQVIDNLRPGEHGALRTEPLRSAPSADALPIGGSIYRGMTVPCTDEAEGYVRVGLLEWEDLEQDPLVLVSERWGWVPADSLCERRVRHFYHLSPTTPTPDTWTQQTPDGDNGDFHLYWVPLVPRPRLVRPQDPWLDGCYQRLLRGASSA